MSKGKGWSKWVIIWEKFGTYDPGFYQRDVSIDLDMAFIHPENGGRNAVVVHSSQVFDTKEEAAKAYAEGGTTQWCVLRNEPKLFLAKVKHHTVERFDRKYRHAVTTMDVKTGEISTDNYGSFNGNVHLFQNKKDAEKFYRSVWRVKKESVMKELEEVQARLDRLMAKKPRSGKKKVDVLT